LRVEFWGLPGYGVPFPTESYLLQNTKRGCFFHERYLSRRRECLHILTPATKMTLQTSSNVRTQFCRETPWCCMTFSRLMSAKGFIECMNPLAQHVRVLPSSICAVNLNASITFGVGTGRYQTGYVALVAVVPGHLSYHEHDS
jgi:hypothetical protein